MWEKYPLNGKCKFKDEIFDEDTFNEDVINFLRGKIRLIYLRGYVDALMDINNDKNYEKNG